MTAADYAWGNWPPSPIERQVRADLATALAHIAAVRAYATEHATGLGSLACDSISARAVLALLPKETP